MTKTPTKFQKEELCPQETHVIVSQLKQNKLE